MPDRMPCELPNRRGLLGVALGLTGAALPAADGETQTASAAEVQKLKKAATDAKFSLLPQIVAYLKRLRGKFGPAVLEEVRQATMELARQWKERAPIPAEKRNLDHVVNDWAQWTEEVTYHWVVQTPKRLEVRVTRCRWAEELKKLGADPEIGLAVICASDYGYCAGLNSAIKFTRTKTIMQGDDHCNHCYKLGT